MANWPNMLFIYNPCNETNNPTSNKYIYPDTWSIPVNMELPEFIQLTTCSALCFQKLSFSN